MDGEGSNGCTSPTRKSKRLLGQSKVASSQQRTRGKKRRPTRVQKMWKSSLLVLCLLFQHEDAHQHLDWPDLANQTEHHLRRRLSLLQRDLLTGGRTMPEEAGPICWQGRRHSALPAEVHRAQGGCEEPLGHWGGRALQPPRARVGPLQLPPL